MRRMSDERNIVQSKSKNNQIISRVILSTIECEMKGGIVNEKD